MAGTVLIIKKSGRQFVCLPLTSKKPKNELFYFDISFVDEKTNEVVNSYVITTNFLTFDVNRLQRKTRKLKSNLFNLVLEKSKNYLNEI